METQNVKPSVRALVESYLDEAKLLQVATESRGQPWLANVWFARDADLNLFFISRKDRRHCQELRDHPQVAGAVVQHPLEGLGQKVRGITFQGVAEEVGILGLRDAYAQYKKRWPQVEKHAGLDALLKNAIATRFYKITPSLIVLFDEVNFPEQPRQELHLGP